MRQSCGPTAGQASAPPYVLLDSHAAESSFWYPGCSKRSRRGRLGLLPTSLKAVSETLRRGSVSGDATVIDRRSVFDTAT